MKWLWSMLGLTVTLRKSNLAMETRHFGKEIVQNIVKIMSQWGYSQVLGPSNIDKHTLFHRENPIMGLKSRKPWAKWQLVSQSERRLAKCMDTLVV